MNLEVNQIAEQIIKASNELTKELDRLEMDNLIEKKASTARDYDKVIGTATATLKAGGEPVTIIRDLAKERAADALYASILAEEILKAHYSKIDVLSKVLNGLQSVFRHLSAMPNGD